jgi:ABC-type polysaccharide/polyol phosphate transport system ATPase subunit
MEEQTKQNESLMKGSDDFSIRVENLTKVYKLYDKPIDRLKESLSPFKKKFHRDFYAVNDVSFNIKRGETLGIIGKNGSGKSTILKMITGVLSPTAGNVQVNGRISALLELGIGFNPEFTGMENIYLNGTILGIKREDMEKKVDDILSFADIGDFINQPVRTYSSGMFARLAFSVAINVDPDILIVDEVLAVGDMSFQAKCMLKMKRMISESVTTIFVSHDVHAVKSLCQKTIYMENGNIKAMGESGEVCDMYISDQMERGGFFRPAETLESGNSDNINEKKEDSAVKQSEAFSLESYKGEIANFKKEVDMFRKGTGDARVIFLGLYDENNNCIKDAVFGQKLKVLIAYKANCDLDELVVAFYIKNKNQIEVIGSNSAYEGVNINNLKKDHIYNIEFSFENRAMAGNYSITAILADNHSNTSCYFDWVDNAFVFKSHDEPNIIRWASWNPKIGTSHYILKDDG